MADRVPGAHIVLVGLPGAGKSAVGKLLAERLKLPFRDFDQEIVRREGRSVSEIFHTDGEAYFRSLEAALTREARGAAAMVLAPGGGWIAQPGFVELLRPPSMLIHLKASPATALARTSLAPGSRPLLEAADPLDRLKAIWEERRHAYESSDLEVDTETLTAEEVSEEVAELIDRSGKPGAATQ